MNEMRCGGREYKNVAELVRVGNEVERIWSVKYIFYVLLSLDPAGDHSFRLG